ncbi:precorrin-3B C(17)-methyltransferase [Paroceanicella profunda]|uniref:Precorrin-3B C(17)-methyltransferase n=1 Tax=Paroceanicella profunda TaxID=2579971 RepID=A0A5B8FIA8_9RHOB|nr:precorrin-3B C(17)-methyltransferase [Paroceanicella profunda]QDL93037.1 precorrin-3B C(17)-methyltransferase [Paroceanicella profunda]
MTPGERDAGNPGPVVLCLTASGLAVARQVAEALDAPLHGRVDRVPAEAVAAQFPDALAHARNLFAAGHAVIGVCAAGILIRAVAPLLSDKRVEPPVLAIPEDGSCVIPLLGGHRGANRLARRIADALGTRAAVTTAGDIALGVALDVPPPGWRLANPEAARAAMAALLSGAALEVEGEGPWRAAACAQPAPAPAAPGAGAGADRPAGPAQAQRIIQTEAPVTGADGALVYHPQRHVLGLGAARGCPAEEVWDLALQVLEAAGVAPGAVACVCSLDLKADEPGILEVARRLGVPARFFPAARLEAEAPRLATPSEVVFAEVGCHGVAEGAALAGAGPDAVLVLPKRKSAAATAALARAPEPLTALRGRRRGRVTLVGIGPGQASWRTPEASTAIARADELVGYGLYIDLLGPLAAGKPRSDFPLGGEEARCRHALEEAGQGRDIALICSGDAGIYAMGALVFELLDRAPDRGGVSDAARRVEVLSCPGVSALQAAAARAGAPLGHDFCAISLSDLLTPREDIVKRLHAAAEGDFVIAFYNPVSLRRRTLLAEARDILLRHRPADTPVLLASSLGRPEESLRYRRLDALDVGEVDMLTVVLVGSSQSRLARLGEGPRMYTPRGYARRIDASAGTDA